MNKAIIAAILSISIGSAFAQATTSPAPKPAEKKHQSVEKRQEAQANRIEKGVASGQVTSKEAERLAKEQAKIDAAQAKAKEDGKVTAKERAKLQGMAGAANKDIKHPKHDKQKNDVTTQPVPAPAK